MITKVCRLVLRCLVGLSCGVSLLVLSGCEVASSTAALVVTPTSAVLSPGQTATFTVSGGYTYTWSLDPDDGSGSLDTRTRAKVTYTCLATNIGTVPKLVKVTSTIGDSAGTSTNSSTTNTSYEVDGYAEVYYTNGAGGTYSSSLAVSPTSTSVATNGTQSFTASGGTSPYTWSVLNSAIGSISSTSGASTTYLRTGNGTNLLTLEDSSGTSVTVVITQP